MREHGNTAYVQNKTERCMRKKIPEHCFIIIVPEKFNTQRHLDTMSSLVKIYLSVTKPDKKM